jgi:hypothetical protein
MCVRLLAVVIRHANRIISGTVVLSSVACPFPLFPHYLINGKIFGKKVREQKMCVLIFCIHLSDTLLILRRIQRDTIIKLHSCLHVKYLLCLSDLMKLEISRQILEKYSNVKFHENP